MKRFTILLCISILVLTGCSDTGTNNNGTEYDATQMLNDIPKTVILGSYLDLESKAGELLRTVTNLQANPTQTALDNAKQAWKNARIVWEQSEGYLFGPVETSGIDPKLDSWPVNKADLDAVLNSGNQLTVDYVAGLEGTLKGFHTIEYLLFGIRNSKTIDKLTSREREYLVACVTNFHDAAAQLADSWNPLKGNYISNLINAGKNGSVYTSQKAALQELINGIIGICDEVADGKIANPYKEQNRDLEESQFSDNSNADFADNIRSVQNVYLGTYGSNSGVGLTALVVSKKPELDLKIKKEINDAIAAIGNMTPTFGEAIFSNKSSVEAAQDAVRTLKITFEAEVLPLVQ